MKSNTTCFDLLKWTKVKQSNWYNTFISNKQLSRLQDGFMVLLFKVDGLFSATETAKPYDYIDPVHKHKEKDSYDNSLNMENNTSRQQHHNPYQHPYQNSYQQPQPNKTLWTHKNQYDKYLEANINKFSNTYFSLYFSGILFPNYILHVYSQIYIIPLVLFYLWGSIESAVSPEKQ